MPGKAAKLKLSEKQLGVLQELSRSRTEPKCVVQRASLVVFAFDGRLNREIAAEVEFNPQQVRAWRHLAIDGKTLRGSHARGKGLRPLTLVSVWATEQGISLGQLAVEEGSNETATIGPLLSMLKLKDSVVSLDAAGTQKEIAAQIIAQKGEYVLTLKANHPTLYTEVTDDVCKHMADDFARVPRPAHIKRIDQ